MRGRWAYKCYFICSQFIILKQKITNDFAVFDDDTYTGSICGDHDTGIDYANRPAAAATAWYSTL